MASISWSWMEQNSCCVSLTAVLMGTSEHSCGGGGQLPVTDDTVSTMSCTCLKGLHQNQPSTNAPRTQHHGSSSSCPQGWTQKAQGRQR